jgi:hypothetical protein
MLKVLIIALALTGLLATEVKLGPKSIEPEVCGYDCLLSLQLAYLDHAI